jgi:hypothetical protein
LCGGALPVYRLHLLRETSSRINSGHIDLIVAAAGRAQAVLVPEQEGDRPGPLHGLRVMDDRRQANSEISP